MTDTPTNAGRRLLDQHGNPIEPPERTVYVDREGLFRWTDTGEQVDIREELEHIEDRLAPGYGGRLPAGLMTQPFEQRFDMTPEPGPNLPSLAQMLRSANVVRQQAAETMERFGVTGSNIISGPPLARGLRQEWRTAWENAMGAEAPELPDLPEEVELEDLRVVADDVAERYPAAVSWLLEVIEATRLRRMTREQRMADRRDKMLREFGEEWRRIERDPELQELFAAGMDEPSFTVRPASDSPGDQAVAASMQSILERTRAFAPGAGHALDALTQVGMTITTQEAYELADLPQPEDAYQLGDCERPGCRGVSGQVNHSFCERCATAIAEEDDPCES